MAKPKQKTGKSSLGGKQITRKQALRGLGDPETWEKDAAKLKKEFSRKPESHPSSPGIRHFPKGSRDERMNRRIGVSPNYPLGGNLYQ